MASALAARQFLTTQILAVTRASRWRRHSKATRAALRQLVERAGPRGSNFEHPRWRHDADPLSLALGATTSRSRSSWLESSRPKTTRPILRGSSDSIMADARGRV